METGGSFPGVRKSDSEIEQPISSRFEVKERMELYLNT
jgi:hypothetical protein